MNIRNNDHLVFASGFSLYEIDEDQDISIKIENNTDSDVFIRIINASRITIEGVFNSGFRSNILFWNDSAEKVEINENYVVYDDCDVTLSYGECNSGDTFKKLDVDMRGSHSNVQINTASLINADKKYNIRLVNTGADTHGEMKNYAVILNNGKLMIDAVGKIVKGAKKSSSHQVSRALSFEKGQSATVLPELLIDENDIQASHAMSIGRVDDKDLYYMMSRGLDIRECTRLISMGYLLPIVDNLADNDLKITMKNELERKIAEVCSM